MDNFAPLVIALMARLKTDVVILTREEIDATKDRLLTVRGDGKALFLNMHDASNMHHEGPLVIQ